MFAEFNWWLLIVGLVVGAGLTWLVLADARRREVDLEEADLADEAVWLERTMAERGDPIDIATAEHMLRLHRAYLGLPPPEPAEPADLVVPAEAADTAEPVAAEPRPVTPAGDQDAQPDAPGRTVPPDSGASLRG
jgi:hypothetical protein